MWLNANVQIAVDPALRSALGNQAGQPPIDIRRPDWF
jgi:hypothetical protein